MCVHVLLIVCIFYTILYTFSKISLCYVCIYPCVVSSYLYLQDRWCTHLNSWLLHH